jgi:hypothetical protein
MTVGLDRIQLQGPSATAAQKDQLARNVLRRQLFMCAGRGQSSTIDILKNALPLPAAYSRLPDPPAGALHFEMTGCPGCTSGGFTVHPPQIGFFTLFTMADTQCTNDGSIWSTPCHMPSDYVMTPKFYGPDYTFGGTGGKLSSVAALAVNNVCAQLNAIGWSCHSGTGEPLDRIYNTPYARAALGAASVPTYLHNPALVPNGTAVYYDGCSANVDMPNLESKWAAAGLNNTSADGLKKENYTRTLIERQLYQCAGLGDDLSSVTNLMTPAADASWYAADSFHPITPRSLAPLEQ